MIFALLSLILLAAPAAAQIQVVAPPAGAQYVIPAAPRATILDARGQTFQLLYSANPNPLGACNYTGADKLPVQRYPVVNPGDVSTTVGVVDAYWMGGKVQGNISLIVPGEILASNGGYCNSAALDFRRRDSTSFYVGLVRIDRVWDGIRFNKETCWTLPGTCLHVVDRVWLSNARDDCIEADIGMSGLRVTESLLDGCFSAISHAIGTTRYNHSAENIFIERTLIRLQGYPYKLQSNYHIAFVKQNPWLTAPWVDIKDSVIAAEHYMVGGSEDTSWPWAQAWRKIRSCSNNVFLWLGDQIPQGLLTYAPACFTVLVGSEARSFWAGARAQWIRDHPGVMQ